MASSEKVVMNLEDFEGSDGTVRHAMDIWSARRGPVKYNQWQSLYFGLVRSGFKDSEAVEDEDQSALQDRIRKMYREIQSEHHGSDHAVQATIESRPMSPAEPVEPGMICLLYTSPSPRDKRQSRMPSSA